MSPFEISILLHYHTRGDDFRDGDFSAPILLPTLERFSDDGLLARVGNPAEGRKYRATEATAVYVNALCAVPAPVQRWVIPSDGGSDGG